MVCPQHGQRLALIARHNVTPARVMWAFLFVDNAMVKNNGGATGKGWLPGQSGNPGGRPKGIAAAAREHKDKCIEVLAAALDSDDQKTQIIAAKELLDRGYGKAIAMSADVTNRLDDLDDDTLSAGIDALRAAIAAAGATDGGTGKPTSH